MDVINYSANTAYTTHDKNYFNWQVGN